MSPRKQRSHRLHVDELRLSVEELRSGGKDVEGYCSEDGEGGRVGLFEDEVEDVPRESRFGSEGVL